MIADSFGVLGDDFFEHEDDISADALMEASFEHSEDLRVEREAEVD